MNIFLTHRVRFAALLFTASASFALGPHASADEVDQLARRGDVAALQALLATNAALIQHVDTNGNTPLHVAASAGQSKAVAFLLDHGATVGATNLSEWLTPLHMAARQGHLASVEVLVAHGAPVNAADLHGCRPLHSAVYAGDLRVGACLLEHGADVNAPRTEGGTPLLYAVSGKHAGMVSLLLQHGANCELATTNGTTPLHTAARLNEPELALQLLEAGAKVDARDMRSATPLHDAAAVGAIAVAEVLLCHGADADAKDHLHFRPVDYVKGATNDALASLLQQHMKSLRAKETLAKVGEAGDADRIVFEGLETFSAADIRAGLAQRPGFQLASHPQANRLEFLKELGSLVESGYEAAGFPDVKAEARYDEAAWQVRVKVSEGPRYRGGRIRVEGAKRASEKELVAWLTQPASGDQKERLVEGPERPKHALWVRGEPADFSAVRAKVLTEQLQACLAEQGLFFAKVAATLERDPTIRTADLRIRIEREGPAGVVGEVEVTGTQRNQPGDIVRYLGLTEGAKLSATRLAEARQRLQDSGRFWAFSITPCVVGGDMPASERVKLQIAVREVEGVPQLVEKLSAEQQACVRLARWLEEFAKRDEDLRLTLKFWRDESATWGAVARVVVSPKAGLQVNTELLRKEGSTELGFRADQQKIQLCSWASRTKLEAPNEHQVNWTLHLLGAASDAEKTNSHFNLTLTGGLQARQETGGAPKGPVLTSDVRIAPAAFLEQLAHSNSWCRIRSGQLVLTNSALVLRADARTGRLIELRYAMDGGEAMLESGKGFWRDASAPFARRAAPLPNLYQPDHGISALCGFALDETTRWLLQQAPADSTENRQRELALRGASRLAHSLVLPSLDEMFAGPATTSFDIPMEAWETSPNGNPFLTMLVGWTGDWSKQLFPKYSWPWTVGREMGFVLQSQGRYTSEEFDRLYNSNDTGPVGCLVIGSLLDYLNLSGAPSFAQRGRERLDTASFLRDAGLLFRGDKGLSRGVDRVAEALRELPQEEVEALAALLPEAKGALLRESAAALRAHPNEAVEGVLAPALARYWEASLRAEVRDGLIRLLKEKKGAAIRS
jgi:ankyrin repeat protein